MFSFARLVPCLPKAPVSLRLSHSVVRTRRLTPSRTFAQKASSDNDFFNFTSGRWVYNEALRLAERRRVFDVGGLRRLAAESVGRDISDVVTFSKLGEGAFNRAFLITMRDGFEMVARVPFEPLYFTVASEVATMDLLRSSGIPVPKVYGYSPGLDNAAKTEYILMEYVRGTSLSDVWPTFKQEEARQVLQQLAELELKVMSLSFPAGGSIYYPHDLEGLVTGRKPISLEEDRFCVGPDVNPIYWYGKRSQLDVDRGPYTSGEAMLVAPARKELAYLKQFGRPLLPRCRMRRKGYHYQEQSPSDHVTNLHRFLRMVPSLVRSTDLGRFCMRHPDLRQGNVIVERHPADSRSGSWRIVSLIDWERTTILPEFLQDSVSRHLHIDGPHDSINPGWHPNGTPSLPENFDQLTEREQGRAENVYHRRFVNHLFLRSGYPWQGEALDMKVSLIRAVENWEKLTPGRRGRGTSSVPMPCPVAFDAEDVQETMELMEAQGRADRLLRLFQAVSHIQPGGQAVDGYYEEAMQDCKDALEGELEDAKTDEERTNIMAHWPFHDRDEEEYK